VLGHIFLFLWPEDLARQCLVNRRCQQVSKKNLPNALFKMMSSDDEAKTRARYGRVLAHVGDTRFDTTNYFLPREKNFGFITIPRGEFLFEKEQVKIGSFCLARYPVTVAQFAEFIRDGGYRKERFWREAREANYWNESGFKGCYDEMPRMAPADYGDIYRTPNHPVVGVTWCEAQAYCRWISEKLGDEMQLPSAEAWQYAASLGKQNNKYPWGDDARAFND